MKKSTLKVLVAAVMTTAGMAAANAADVTLRYTHFWPSASRVHTDVFVPWAKSIEDASNGRIRVQVFPAQTLAKADGSYQATVNGVADIVSTVQGYTAGRFPLSQIAEFPGLSGSALQGGCILQGLYDKNLLDKEYQDTRVLYMFTTGPGTLHTRNKSVPNPEALKGLRMRNPSAIAGQVLQEAGARNVSMPAPEAYESMQRGVIDGTAFPWEAMQVFRLNELATHHTDVAIYSTAFVTAMNKNSYERLPDDLKKVIDEHSGAEWQRKAAAVFDALDVEGREFAKKAGHEIIAVEDPMNDPAWRPVLQTVIDNYLSDLKKQNLPGDEVYAAAQDLKTQCPVSAS